MLEDEDTPAIDYITIEPPDAGLLTDEDEADEDTGGLVSDLTGNQLRAPAIAVTVDGDILETHSDTRSKRKCTARGAGVKRKSSALHSPGQSGDGNKGKKSKPKSLSNEFKAQTDLPRIETNIFPNQDFSQFRDLSPYQCFHLFWNNDLIEFIKSQTIAYAGSKGYHTFTVSEIEIRAALGILLCSGYNHQPSRRSYWDIKNDLGCLMITECMSRNRFEEILKFLHFADNNNLDLTDKYTKIRPLINQLKETFKMFFIPEQNLSYDESMIEYYGRHSCKQSIRNKPIRFGFKAWSLYKTDGYCIDFSLYQGKYFNAPESYANYEQKFGKATAPLVAMMDNFDDEVKNLPLNFYTDNLFTSENLLLETKERGYGCTGAFREGRTPANIPLPSKAEIKSQPRGYLKYTTDTKNNIIYARWRDNGVLGIASNTFGVEPMGAAKRWSKAEAKHVKVSRPNLVKAYNQGMGGTDQMDQNVNNLRIAIRGKKFYFPIFTWLLDVSVNNAWSIFRKCGHGMSQLDFKRRIVEVLCRREGGVASFSRIPHIERKSNIACKVPEDLRYDRINHFLVPWTRNYCVNCPARVRSRCKKCNVGLCLDCNVPFHTK